MLESDNADAELLAALAELAIGEPAESAEAHREIRFLTLSDRARAEATSQQRQPELVERLIKDSISQPRFRPEESRVLFELTVPNELKSGLAQVDNLVLVVDAESAAYPWELMSRRRQAAVPRQSPCAAATDHELPAPDRRTSGHGRLCRRRSAGQPAVQATARRGGRSRCGVRPAARAIRRRRSP